MTAGEFQTALAEFAIESWRFAKQFRRLVSKLDANEQTRFTNKLNYFNRRVEFYLAQADLKLVDLEGQFYDMGMAADVLNPDEYSTGDELVIEQMIEPLIISPGGIVRTGKALVKRARCK